MKDNLEQLKTSLDQHVFSHNTFDHDSEQKIKNRLHQERQKNTNKTFYFGNFYKPVLSLIVLLAFSTIIFFFITEGDPTKTPADSPSEKTPVEPEPSEKEMISQQDVYSKMLNSSPYFTSASGSYTEVIEDKETTVNFTVDNIKNHYYLNVKNSDLDIEKSFNGSEKRFVDHNEQSFSITQMEKNDDMRTLDEMQYLYPNEIAKKYLQDFSTWEITGTEDRNEHGITITIEAKGDHNQYKMKVMESTGIVLELVDNNENTSVQMSTDRITKNEDYSPDQFLAEIPSDYKDLNQVEDSTTEDESTDEPDQQEEALTPAEELVYRFTNYKPATFDALINATKEEVIQIFGKPIKEDAGTPGSDHLPSITYEHFIVQFGENNVRAILFNIKESVTEKELIELLKDIQYKEYGPGMESSATYLVNREPFDIGFLMNDNKLWQIRLYDLN